MILARRAVCKSGGVQGLGEIRRVFRGFPAKFFVSVPLELPRPSAYSSNESPSWDSFRSITDDCPAQSPDVIALRY
jgi:hypothetical protein